MKLTFSLALQELAEYLKYLDKNPDEYAKYHAWRRDYGVEDMIHFTPGPMHAFCKLCAALHNKDEFEKNSWHVKPHDRDTDCSVKRWDFSFMGQQQ